MSRRGECYNTRLTILRSKKQDITCSIKVLKRISADEYEKYRWEYRTILEQA